MQIAKLVQTPEEWQLLIQGKSILKSKKLCSLLKVYNKYLRALDKWGML